MKKFFARNRQDTSEGQGDEGPSQTNDQESQEQGATGGPSEDGSTRKGARFSDDVVEPKPKKGGLRFAEPPPPSASSGGGKKKDQPKKRVVVVTDEEEGGKRKTKPTSDKQKKKEPVPPVGFMLGSNSCLALALFPHLTQVPCATLGSKEED